jgi:class 3 adenylate cyclase
LATVGRSKVTLPLRILHWAVDAAFIVAITSFIILFGLQFPHSPRLAGLSWIQELHRYGDPIIAWPASWVRLEWPPATGFSFLPLGVAFAFWLVKLGVDGIFLGLLRWVDRLFLKPEAAGAGQGWVGKGGPGDMAISADSERGREELLKRYRQIEQALKSSKRKRCTFLSIDVVGSTKMKVGEREAAIAATFQAYEEMLRKIFDQYGAWKQAWTPDGVMICFLQPDLAAGAAKRILERLKHFNESENKLRTPFQLRCGVNEGEVPIFEDTRLEKLADRVIDVAGHLQKQSTPDVLFVSAPTYGLLADKSGFQPSDQEVDGYKVYQWSVETAVTPAQS